MVADQLGDGPADRPAVEQAVRQAYQAAGFRPPAHIVWLGSPLAGVIAVAMLRNSTVSDRSPDAYWSAVRTRLWGQLGGPMSLSWSQPSLWSPPSFGSGSRPPAGAGPASRTAGGAGYRDGERWGQAHGSVWVELPVWSGQAPTGMDAGRFRFGVEIGEEPTYIELLYWEIRNSMRFRGKAHLQLHEMAQTVRLPRLDLTEWLTSAVAEVKRQAFPDVEDEDSVRIPRGWGKDEQVGALARVIAECRLTGTEITPGAAAMVQVTRSSSWWWPLEHVSILTERPTVLYLDAQYRLHSAIGPALAYPDGLSVWAWHGVVVPREVIQQPERLTVRQIRQEPNLEVGRVMLERYGPGRYLRDAGAERVSQDDTGTLWRTDIGGGVPLVMVEVRDSTPEPDGGRRAYWLRVPPGVRTAREAVAWTFGLAAEGYRPVVET